MNEQLQWSPLTDEQVSQIINEFHVPLHVQRHCKTVAEMSVKIADGCISQGIEVKRKLLEHAALLHDFVRVVDFREFDPRTFPDPPSDEDVKFWESLRIKYKGMHHADTGADILESRGLPALAQLVRAHRYIQIKDGFDSLEEKILYYADKRAKHDKIVSLDERLQDGRRRNTPNNVGETFNDESDKKIHELENELMNLSGLPLK